MAPETVVDVELEDPLADYRLAQKQMRAKLTLIQGGLGRQLRSEMRSETTVALKRRALAIRERLRRLAYRWICDVPDCNGLPHDGMWHKHARAEQRIPVGVWLIWAIISGRGWGKTKTGAETCKEWASRRPQHVAVIGETFTKVRDLCFEHPTSGLIAVTPPEQVKSYTRALGGTVLQLHNGTVYRGLSAEKPDAPRGYAFDKAWYDEYGAWPPKVAPDVHSNVMFALRESDDPRIVITTTPRPTPHVKVVVEEGLKSGSDVVLTRGHMRDNAANLGAKILAKLMETYEGTRLGRQELAGELLDDVEGALWQLWMFEAGGFRVSTADVPPLARLVIGMDPAASDSDTADLTGIAAVGVSHPRDVTYGDQRPHGYVLKSFAVRGGPEKRCAAAAEQYHLLKADYVVYEANKGGDWIPAVMRQVDPRVKVKAVNATRGKITRAQPVASLYEQQRMHHVHEETLSHVDRTEHAQLEEQMTTWVEGDPDSPDIMDALVWAVTELMVDAKPIMTSDPVNDQRLAGRR